MSEHGEVTMRPMYFVWAWLLGLTMVEVLLAYFHLPPLLMLLALLGLSVVKAALIMAYFMHLKFERLNLVLTIVPAMVLCILLLNVFFPDSLRLREHGVNRDARPAAPAHR
jgi:cytochrome c oxidase subunit 4